MAVRFGFLSLVIALSSLIGCGSESATTPQPPQESVVNNPTPETRTEPVVNAESDTQPATDEKPAANTKEALVADFKAIFAEYETLTDDLKDVEAAKLAAKKIKATRPRWVELTKRMEAFAAASGGEIEPLTPEERKQMPSPETIAKKYLETNPEIALTIQYAMMTAMTGIEIPAPKIIRGGEDLWSEYAGRDEIISPDGKVMVTFSSDRYAPEGTVPMQVKVWDTATGNKLHEWEEKFYPHRSAITNNGKTLVCTVTSNSKEEIRAWELPAGKPRFSASLDEFTSGGNLTISADDSTAYLMSAGEGYYAIDLSDGTVTTLLKGGWGDLVVTPETGLGIQNDLTELEVFKSPEDFAQREKPIAVVPTIPYAQDVQCSGNGHFVAATYDKRDGLKKTPMVAVYDLKSQTEVLNIPIGLSPEDDYSQLAISYDGQFVVICDPNISQLKMPYLFDVQAKQRIPLKDFSMEESVVGFTPAGILITKRDFKYQFVDPKTRSRIMPPLGAEHFHLKP